MPYVSWGDEEGNIGFLNLIEGILVKSFFCYPGYLTNTDIGGTCNLWNMKEKYVLKETLGEVTVFYPSQFAVFFLVCPIDRWGKLDPTEI